MAVMFKGQKFVKKPGPIKIANGYRLSFLPLSESPSLNISYELKSYHNPEVWFDKTKDASQKRFSKHFSEYLKALKEFRKTERATQKNVSDAKLKKLAKQIVRDEVNDRKNVEELGFFDFAEEVVENERLSEKDEDRLTDFISERSKEVGN